MNTPQKHTHCLLCNGTQLAVLPEYRATHLVQCGTCSFVFAQQIPSEQELIAHYEGYSRNDYLSPITIKRYHELLDTFEPYRKTGKLLDVGCGIGYFLEVAKERGWEVYGTEYTDEAMAICREKGISMQQGKLTPSNYSPEQFDIITSFEVIEHINNPQEEIAHFSSLLRVGGLVYVTTPNFNSLLRYRLKSDYDVITYPEHLSYYTPKTIKYLFKKNGFNIHKILTTGISISRLKSGKSGVQQEYISESSDDEKMRQKMEEKWHLKVAKKAINSLLTLFGKGDSLKGYFVKRP